MSRQFGQSVRPSGRGFGQQGSLTVDNPSLIEKRNEISRLADDQRQERNLYRRVARGLNRRLRKGDTEAGSDLIELMNQGRAAGIQMTGIPSADENINYAVHRHEDGERNRAAASGLVDGGGSWQSDSSGGSSFVPAPEVIGGPNDGGNTQTQSPSGTLGTTTRTSSILERRYRQLGGSGVQPVFSTRDTTDVASSPGLPPLATERELASNDRVIRGDDGRVIGRATTPESVTGTRSEPEPQPGAFDRFSTSFVNNIGSSLASGRADRLQEAMDLYQRIESGEINMEDLPPEQRDFAEEGGEFLLFQEDTEKYGREAALSRAVDRAAARRKKRSEDRQNAINTLESSVSDLSPRGLLAATKPRDRIARILGG